MDGWMWVGATGYVSSWVGQMTQIGYLNKNVGAIGILGDVILFNI